MTRIDFGPPFLKPLVDSADRLMVAAHENPGLLNTDLVWYFVLPWLDNSQDEREQFWKMFNQKGAEDHRRIALSGAKFSNFTEEMGILGLVEEFKALIGVPQTQQASGSAPLFQSIAPSNTQRQALVDQLLKKLGGWVLGAILYDHSAPKRLHQLLTNSEANSSEYADQPTLNGRVLRSFVALVSDKWRLPTKKAVRTNSGLSDDASGISTASGAFRVLGLSGLPQG